MRQIVAFFILFFTGNVAIAQVTISGQVTGQGGKPLHGVSIAIKDSYDGATTDSLGNFSFHTDEKGQKTLDFSFAGYFPQQRQLEIGNKPINLKISMKEKITELNAVVITAGSFEASDKKKGTVLTSLDIVTTAGSNGDVTGALQTLPGTQQVGESEGLFVRGGSATESKIFIDGALVNNFFYSTKPGIASRGRFNPFLFKGTQFSTGGYSALYGQALSSALVLESNDLAEQSEGNISVSIVGLGAGIQQLAKNKKSSWGATYGLAYLRPAFQVIKQRQQFTTYPLYHDGDFNFRIKRGKLLVKYYAYMSVGKTGFKENDIDSVLLKNHFSLKNFNTYQNLSARLSLSKGWKLNGVLSAGTDNNDTENELQNEAGAKQLFSTPTGYNFKNYNYSTDAFYGQARLVAEKRLQGLSAVRFGAEHFYGSEKSAYTLYTGQKFDGTVNSNLFAAFGEWDVYITKDLAAKAGIRTERSSILNKWNVAPRLSLAYRFANNSLLSFAYGKFYQQPERRYLPAISQTSFAEATHYILQYQASLKGRLLRAEVFYKNYDQLYKTGINNFGAEAVANNNGNGYAKGIEIFWRDRKSLKMFDYWVSYSFLDTKRNYLNFPGMMEPNFASAHTASLVLKSFFIKMKTGFNLSHTFATGRPYYQLLTNTQTGQTSIGDNGYTKPYNNLSFSVNYLPWLGKKGPKAFSVLVLMINNIAGFNNVFGYNYGAINNRKEAILPTGKRFVFLGWFMNIGVDRTQDAINNNL